MKPTTRWEQIEMCKSAGLGLMVALFLLSPGIVCSQDEIRPDVTADQKVLNNESAPNAAGDAEIPANDATRKRRAMAGLAAVAGIAILGVTIIAATMVWARRLRRLARNMGPPQRTIGNDFWFLKPPKPVANEPEISNSHRPPLGEKRDEPE